MNFGVGNAWRELNQKTIGGDRYWHIAVQNEAAFADTVPLIKAYVAGRTLDVGAGRLAWRPMLSQRCSLYLSADFFREHPDLDLVFDATRPFPFSNGSFDTVFCYSVLEHTQKPWLVMPELHRITRQGGTVIVSVPFIFYLHGAPHDYFRFTRFGLTRLAEDAGFSIEKLVLNGGIFHFLLNIPSVALSALLSAARLSFLITPVTRFLTLTARLLDGIFDPSGLFAMNVICVLRKR